MADVAKVVTVIGNSPESFAKAADAAVQEAAKTLRGITGADVISMSAEVTDGKITSYRTSWSLRVRPRALGRRFAHRQQLVAGGAHAVIRRHFDTDVCALRP